MQLLLLFFLSAFSADASHVVSSYGPDRTGDPTQPRLLVEATPLPTLINLDGRLDEPFWQAGPTTTTFMQREPEEGAQATERTEVRMYFDDDAIYVGARMYDSAPDSITARLGRRDAELDADKFTIFIDPFYDKRTGFYFSVNAAGTRYDGVLMNDDWDDDSWDGVWEGKAAIDEEGWTAEMRIPFSQIRFHSKDELVWGVNFYRFIERKNEEDYLVYTPLDESGFVSRFVDLIGMKDIKPRNQVEMLPYVTTRAEFTEQDASNPFNDGSQYIPTIGADFRVGVTSNLTLNGTVNPDFGQVEVDPAVVNLSDVEVFFPERRPFFIEGSSIFNFGYGGASNHWGFNWGNPDLFYTRRIGRAPQGSLSSHDYADVPDGTRILGAAKLTGKIGEDWNFGTVQSVTARERAELELDGARLSEEVEPLSYYGVVRAQREFQEGRQGLGFISTTALRQLRDERLENQFNGEAFVGGIDGWVFLDSSKTWVLSGWTSLSHVQGSTQRILDLQQNSQHYFQRPDAGHVSIDSSATSLTGMAGRFSINKQRGNVVFNSAIGFISPSFDVNDLGFQWRTDMINSHIGGGYRWSDPGSFYRRITLLTSFYRTIDFDGNTVWTGNWGLAYWQLPNYYEVEVGYALNPETTNNRRTRGGPLTTNPPGYEFFGEVSTDSRKAWVFEVEGFTYQSDWTRESDLGIEVEWKPATNILVSLNPRISWNFENTQWVGAFDDPLATATFGRRYVFAELDQITVSSSLRVNWTFTPNLSFQLFAQPLISSGEYANYKELDAPKTYDFNLYGEGGSTFSEETLIADPDGEGPAAAIELPQQDFTFKSLRGTAVLRWEIRPGSTLFFVWTQTRSEAEDLGMFRFRSSVNSLLDAKPDNVFMVKLSYWLSR